ncbi:MAG: hypothetical protein Q7S65_00995 [Nanoarchaeota archaeon]|nr:hypothetical protein [Nanoarchaeota archaeon]
MSLAEDIQAAIRSRPAIDDLLGELYTSRGPKLHVDDVERPVAMRHIEKSLEGLGLKRVQFDEPSGRLRFEFRESNGRVELLGDGQPATFVHRVYRAGPDVVTVVNALQQRYVSPVPIHDYLDPVWENFFGLHLATHLRGASQWTSVLVMYSNHVNASVAS